jgi:hypothetical protein
MIPDSSSRDQSNPETAPQVPPPRTAEGEQAGELDRTSLDLEDLNILTPAEREILAELQALAAAGVEAIDEALLARIKSTIHWSFDDPESMKRAVVFAAHDPFLRREVEAINREFAVADRDGLKDLEDY